MTNAGSNGGTTTGVKSKRGRAVNKEQFKRETNYGAAMVIARAMLTKGLITGKDFCKIDTMFRQKYRPIIGGTQAKNP